MLTDMRGLPRSFERMREGESKVSQAETRRCAMNRLVAAGAVTYAAIGVASFVRPARVPATFGGTAPTAAARTEIRSVYGGLPLAIAATLVTMPTAAAPMGVVSLGMAAGRAASTMLEDEPPTRATRFFGALEIGLGVALLLGSRRRH
jgi:hypothetical protein